MTSTSFERETFIFLIFLSTIAILYLNSLVKLNILKHVLHVAYNCYYILPTLNFDERNSIMQKLLNQTLDIINVNKIITGNASIDEPKIYICNHQSYADPIILKTLFPHLFFVAKSDILDDTGILSSLIKPISESMNVISYKRGNKKDGSKVRHEIAKAIHQKKSVLLFPEGTAYPFGGVHEFYPGSFEIAYENNIKIQPITIKYMTDITWGVKCEKSKDYHYDLLKNVMKASENKINNVHIHIHDEIIPSEYEDANHLKMYAHYIMQQQWISKSVEELESFS